MFRLFLIINTLNRKDARARWDAKISYHTSLAHLCAFASSRLSFLKSEISFFQFIHGEGGGTSC